jgi:hypothetical protein
VKNFDIGREARKKTEDQRSFTIGGETFVAKDGVHPSALAAYDAITESSGVAQTLATVDDLILAMIEDKDNAHERYRIVRANETDIISVEDLLELVRWLVELQTGRPTGQPGDSSPGAASTETQLTGVS